jgi:hypothetical protein
MFNKEMQDALIADGEKLSQITGEDHGPHFMSGSDPCPRCGEYELYRESVDVGVGVIHGPYGCPCGWSEDEEYDAEKGGGWQEDGGYCDPYGGYWPKDNPVVKMMRAGEAGE